MKGFIKSIVVLMIIIILSSLTVTAEGLSYQEQYDELLHSSGADKLYSILPKDATDILKNSNIHSVDDKTILNISFVDFIKGIWISVKNTISLPLTLLATSVGIILLCSLLNSLKSSFNNQSYEHMFSAISVICIATAIITPIAQLIVKTANVIKTVSNFMLSFIPVYVGIVTASGKPVSAVTYSGSIITVVQIISRIAATVLVPMLGIYLAFCLIGAASSQINVEAIARSIKNAVITILGFFLTIFIGLLTIQGVVATSADTVTMRAAKFATSAFLPVVGAAVSEALSSIQGCVGVIKSTVGAFGVIAIIAIFLPSIITVLMLQLSLSIAGAVSEMLDTHQITSLMKSASMVLSLLNGILIVFAVMMTVSVTIMLTLTTGGS